MSRHSPNPAGPAAESATLSGGAFYRSWRNVRIDGGGFVSGLVASPVPGGPLFARTDVGGAYLWQPAATDWKPITDNVENARQIESLAAGPLDPDKVYLATAGELKVSADLGRTWTSHKMGVFMAGNGDGRCVGERLAVDPNKPGMLFFGSRRDGLLRSDDGGANWAKVSGFPDTLPDIGIAFVVFDKRSGVPGQGSRVV